MTIGPSVEALGIELATGRADAPQPATATGTGGPTPATEADTGDFVEAPGHDADANNAALTVAYKPKTRAGTKQATPIAMLSAEDGTTIDEVMTATGWQAHTVRGAIAGALKKKLGLTVASEKVEQRGRVYRIV